MISIFNTSILSQEYNSNLYGKTRIQIVNSLITNIWIIGADVNIYKLHIVYTFINKFYAHQPHNIRMDYWRRSRRNFILSTENICLFDMQYLALNKLQEKLTMYSAWRRYHFHIYYM